MTSTSSALYFLVRLAPSLFISNTSLAITTNPFGSVDSHVTCMHLNNSFSPSALYFLALVLISYNLLITLPYYHLNGSLESLDIYLINSFTLLLAIVAV